MITSATATYSAVQIASDPRMPIGRSFLGFLASSAVVATTSKPMKAKKTIDAPAKTPVQPYWPGVPVMACQTVVVHSTPVSPAGI